MKILILSDANSIHTRRWVSSLRKEGQEIRLVSLTKPADDFYDRICVRCSFYNTAKYDNSIKGKFTYLWLVRYVNNEIKDFCPDLLHAHYASSYGFIGALTNFHPYVVSVWGSDVYDFPQINIITKLILKFVLRKADLLLSTSKVMAAETNKYTNKCIGITPFGVDTDLFKPCASKSNEIFVIGTVKTMAPTYGIDYLIKAFSILRKNNPNKSLKLEIYGDGPCKSEYQQLADDLNLGADVKFGGKIPNSDLPSLYSRFNVAVFLSNRESFGVVAVETMSCETPVVVSDADGFTEVVEDTETGFIVPKKNAEAAADAIQKYIDNPLLVSKFGKAGRSRVIEKFQWNNNVEKMIEYYNQIIK